MYFVALRGFAVLMVVAIHTYKVGFSSNADMVNLAIRQILNGAVPLFFAMSGFFVYRKTLTDRKSVSAFWGHQIPKVYVPALMWSLPLFLLAILKDGSIVNNSVNLLICGFSVYYFIAVIIQFYLLLPVLQRWKAANMGGVILSIIVSMIAITIITYLNVVLDLKLPLIIYAGCGLLWLMFFEVGCFLSVKSRNYTLKIPLLLLIIGFMLSCVESYHLLSHYTLGFGIKPSSFVFSLGFVLVMMSKKVEEFYNSLQSRSAIVKVLEYIGSVSFAVYLIHCYAISWILPRTGCINGFWFSRWLMVVIVSLVGIMILKRIVPSKYKYLIGIYD